MGGGSQHVRVGALRVAYERSGAGPPLLLLHGLPGDSREWRPQLEGLSDAFTVIAWDAPGCGGSDDPPQDIGMDGLADCLAGFVEALELERPHVVGLSFGAGLALALFGRHPGIPRSLVLASGYAGWAGSLPPEEVRARVERALLDAESPPDEVAQRFARTLFDEDQLDSADAREVIAVLRDFHPAGLRALAPAFAEADLRDVLPRVDVPTLLIYGDADMRAPPAVAHAMHEGLRDARLVMLPGAGHMVNYEARERFDEELRAFLAAA